MVVNISPFRDHDKSVNWGLGWLWGRLRWSSCSPPSQFLPPVGLGAATLLSFPALLTGSLPGLTLPVHNLLILLLKTPSQSGFWTLGLGTLFGEGALEFFQFPPMPTTATNRDSGLFVSVLLFFSSRIW